MSECQTKSLSQDEIHKAHYRYACKCDYWLKLALERYSSRAAWIKATEAYGDPLDIYDYTYK